MTRPTVTIARNSLASALVVGTVLAVDPAGWFAFTAVKWLVTTTLAAAVVALTAWTGTWRRPDRRSAVLLALFLGWLAVCAALGADPRYAWLGTPERHAGWLLWIICGGLFLCAVPLRAITDGLVVAGSVLAPVLLIDAGGHPIVASGTQRLTGTFGSAAYLAAACTLIAPVALGVALDAELTRWRRVLGWVAAAGGLFGIVGSGTRGAWVAGIIIAFGCTWKWRRSRVTATVIAGAAIVIVVAALLTPVGRRIGDIGDRDAGGGVSRLDEWRVAAAVIAEHPIVGSGPEGYRINFRDGVDAAYERAHGRDPQPDRAHNGLLDTAAVGGVPAAALLLALVVVVSITIRRRVAGLVNPSATGAAIGLAAYVLQQQFLFPLAELEPIVWMLAGAVAIPSDGRTAVHRQRIAPARIGVVTCSMLALAAAWWGTRDVLADRAAARAIAATDRTIAVDEARKAVALRGDEVRLQLLLARVSADPAEQRSAFAAASEWSPDDPILLVRHAEFLAATDPAAAILRLQLLLGRDPDNATLHALLGTADARTGDAAGAEREWLRALDLAPDSTGPRANLITLYRQQGRDTEANQLEDVGNR